MTRLELLRVLEFACEDMGDEIEEDIRESKAFLENIRKANQQYIRDAREWSPCNSQATIRHIEIFLEGMNYEIEKELRR